MRKIIFNLLPILALFASLNSQSQKAAPKGITAGAEQVSINTKNNSASKDINKVAGVFNLCAGTNSTSSTSGTLYDSGGPSGYYMDGENCQFLINPGCTGTISISFNQFNTESCCDRLSVYNGTNTAAPLLGTYQGYTIPPTLTANSGKMLLVWYTDGSVVDAGFSATWTSTISGTTPPVANFTVSNTNPPLGTNVQFTDQTTNTPFQWLWEFGDGTTSAIQNPLKLYSTSGIKTITLTATNCNTTSITSKTIVVQNAPTISVAPGSISVTASCGSSVTATATVSNSGTGDLTYTTTASGSGANIKILVISNLTYPNYVSNMLTALNNYSVNYTVTQHTLTNVSALQTALTGKDVVIFPQPYNGTIYTSGYFQTYSLTVNNFVNNGGTAIMSGFYYSNMVNDLGLFTSTNSGSFGSGVNINVVDTNNAITKGLPLGNITSYAYNYYHTFSNAGINNYAEYSSYQVISKRNLGSGRAIYLAFDYQGTTNVNFNKVLANSVKSSITSATWLSGSPTTSSVVPGSSSAITYTFNSG